MKEVIDRLLEGNFDYENGSLDFSCSKLELTIKQGESLEGSFKILGDGGRYTQGYVLASDSRMECLTTEFIGSEEEIFFCFHGEDLAEGDVVKGEFYIISNQGEYYLPYVINVEYTVIMSSLGNVKNLFHFSNLAKTSPEEAVNLFYSSDFYRILNGNDRQFYDYYRGMSVFCQNEQNVEEFLIGINKKQRIEYLLDTDSIRIEDPEGIAETGITITRNGWGYTRLRIDTVGDFLFLQKEIITDQDFSGNSCRLTVNVDSSLLHDGNNFGKIIINNCYEEIEVSVLVKCNASGNQGRRSREKKRLILQLMEFYQAFRMKKISTDTWLKESSKLVERMAAKDEQNISARLFQSQLLITEERYNEAQWILDHVADILDNKEEEEPVLEAYYLYLSTLLHRDEDYINQVTERVEYIYKRNQNEWRLAWLLLYLSPEYNRSFSQKWLFLEKQFDRGCTSPVIYIEALLLLNLNPSLLIKLGEFERQILLFGAKREMLSGDSVMQFLYLVQKERDFSDLLYRTLEACYKVKQDVSVLQEICSLLIKGNKIGKKYFKWYKRGVENELRITRLYDHYLLSVDMNTLTALPKMVLMYFSYQNSLNYEMSAFLYANVYRNRDSFPEIYESYRNQIEQFIIEQILNLRINRNLAYLYKNLLLPRMLTPEVAQALSELLFVHLIQINRIDIRYVIVFQPQLNVERCYPVTDGRAYISLPDAACSILMEDNLQNRYMASVPYTTEKLMLPGKLVKLVAPLAGNVQDLNIFMCLDGQDAVEVNKDNESRFRYLLEDEEINDSIKNTMGMKLMSYYYEYDKIRDLDEYLEYIEPNGLFPKERGEVMRYMTFRGKENKAYDWLKDYGPFGIDPKVIVRLCARIMHNNECVEDEALTQAALYAFRRGKYDEQGLRYLVLYFKGLTKEMRDIWKAAEAFYVDTYELCERMLIQMLFSGSFVGEKLEIFRSYVAGGAKSQVEEAFLFQCAYEYFVKDRVTTGYIFEEILGMYRRKENLHRVCKLSFIKYYAENKTEVTDEIKDVLKDFLHEMLRDGIHLKMFTEFMDFNDACINQLSDKTIVEYKAHPKSRAVMHYCVETADGEELEYITEEMQEVYGGVCFKSFVLFFGERLQYYIMEVRDDNEQLTESATIQKSDTINLGIDGQFNLVNDISISNILQDYDTVDKLLAEYEYKEFMRNRLFKLI